MHVPSISGVHTHQSNNTIPTWVVLMWGYTLTLRPWTSYTKGPSEHDMRMVPCMPLARDSFINVGKRSACLSARKRKFTQKEKKLAKYAVMQKQ
jgi:hypothetical protein